MKKVVLLLLSCILVFLLISCGETPSEEETTTTKTEEKEMNVFNVTDYGVLTDSKELQTEKVQAVLDLCKAEGGTVVFPAGTYYVASLYVNSNTTIHLAENAILYGSDEINDYTEFPIPNGMELYTNIEFYGPMMPEFFTNLKQYRTAMFNAYGEENITIEGEGFTSIVNGRDCYNPNGEENFRGPFGFFFANCNNIAFENFSSERHGNFHFCLTGCDGVKVNKMQMLAGHDGVHLMMSKNIKVVDCIIHTGDDSISGCYLQNFYMNRCDVNTSCNAFRTSGENLVVENTKIWGPGIYPHRITVVKGNHNYLSDTEGRHNLCALYSFLSTSAHPVAEASDLTFINCEISNITQITDLTDHPFHLYKPFGSLSFINCTITGVEKTSYLFNPLGGIAEISFSNTPVSYADPNCHDDPITFAPKTTNIVVIYD